MSLAAPRSADFPASAGGERGPALCASALLATCQIFGWLFFHPASWKRYVRSLDLAPDFALSDLRHTVWRRTAVRRLIVLIYGVAPLLLACLVSLVLWPIAESPPLMLFGIALICVVSYAMALLSGLWISVAAGAASLLLTGLSTTLLSLINRGSLIELLNLARANPNLPAERLERLLVSSLISGFVGSLCVAAAGTVAVAVSESITAQPRRRMLGAIISGIVGIALLFPLGWLLGLDSGYLLPYALAFGLLMWWRTSRLLLGFGAALFFGMLAYAVNLISAEQTAVARQSLLAGALEGLASGIFLAIGIGAFFILPYLLAWRLAGPWAGAISGGLAIGGVFFGGSLLVADSYKLELSPLLLSINLLAVALGLSLNRWRPLLTYPAQLGWGALLQRVEERRSAGAPTLLWRHAAFWDQHQWLRLYGLDDYLVLVCERWPAEGQAAIEQLATGRQRWAAQAAQIELDARWLERCLDVAAIAGAQRQLAAGELEGPGSALLRSLSRISQDVAAALHQESAYNQRLALSAVEDRLDGLLRELTRSSESYAARFRQIATSWRRVVGDQGRALAAFAEQRQEIDSPYIIGIPLTAQQEIFVGRVEISAMLERLLLDRRAPPLLLFGQRRMGKTSLLNNLGRLLPSTVVPLFVDLQGPASQASDHAGLLYNLGRGMLESARMQRGLSLPPLSRQQLAEDPFTCFDEWLDQLEQALPQQTILLALDEFEALDDALERGRFSETAVLGMLRHMIQHRPRMKILLAGSHTFDELARWSSYLINVQIIEIGYLRDQEARQLIERPVKDFALRYEPEACQRVLVLTRGHPTLVQLLCSEIVALKNSQPPATRRLARLADVEAAVPEALTRGSFFFADIERNQVDAAGLALLRRIAAAGEGVAVERAALAAELDAPPEPALALLRRRALVEPAGPGYRFQVELIRRWFRQRIHPLPRVADTD